MIHMHTDSPIDEPGSDPSSVSMPAYSLDAQMLAALPQLKDAVKQGWKNYRLDPQHAHINAMREEVKLLAYWLARDVARSSWVHYQEDDTARKVRVGAFGNQSPTELHHQLYAQVFDKHTVTELVSSADKDLVGFLYTILKNSKTSLYRKWRTEIRYMKEGHAGAAEDDEGEEGGEGGWFEQYGHELTPERVAEGMQVLQRFVAFLEAEQLNPTLEKVALALWLSAPLSDNNAGDISENTENTDIKLAQSLDIPKSTFDRHKGKARDLVQRFRRLHGL